MASRQEIAWITDEDCKLQDNAKLIFGDGVNREAECLGDIYMAWDGTDFDITQGGTNSAINVGVDGAGMDFKLFGDTAGAYLLWDQSTDDLILAGAAGLVLSGTAGLSLGDDAKLSFGASADITIDWNVGGGLDILQAAADSAISFGVNDAGIDVKLFGDAAGAYLLWDQSGNELIFEGADLWLKDDDQLELGDASDVVIDWATAGGLYIAAAADNTMIYVGTGTAGFDLTWFGGDANTTVTFNADGGSGLTGAWAFGADDHGVDVTLHGATASSAAVWDESANELVFVGADLWLKDDDQLEFGASSDVIIDWATAGGLYIAAAADNSMIYVGTGTAGFDLTWFGGDANTTISFNADGGSGATGAWAFGADDHGVDVSLYGATSGSLALWDESADELVFDGADLWLKDGDQLEFGDASDVVLRWDGTDFDILPAADSVLKFGNGTHNFDVWFYGNTADNYLLWDESANTLALAGSAQPTGFNSLPTRYELKWVAGQEGLVDLNNTAWSDVIDARFEILGTNGSADDVTYYAEGGLTLETDGADGDEVILLPHLDSNQSPWTTVTWGTDQETHWECQIKTGASIDNCIIWAGLKLTDTEVTITDADQAFFRYENAVGAGNWQAISSIADSDDAHDSGVTVAINTDYHLKIVIQANRTALFYINNVLVETSAALTDATDLIPYIGVASDGAAEPKVLHVRGQAISRKFA